MSVSPIFPTKFSLEDNGQVAETGQSADKNVSISYTLGEVSLASASNLGVVSDYDIIDAFPEETISKEAEPTVETAQEEDLAAVAQGPASNLATTPELPAEVTTVSSTEGAAGTDEAATSSARYTPTQYAFAIAGGVAAGLLTVYVVNKLVSR